MRSASRSKAKLPFGVVLRGYQGLKRESAASWWSRFVLHWLCPVWGLIVGTAMNLGLDIRALDF